MVVLGLVLKLQSQIQIMSPVDQGNLLSAVKAVVNQTQADQQLNQTLAPVEEEVRVQLRYIRGLWWRCRGFVDATIYNPSSSYSYAVGTAGSSERRVQAVSPVVWIYWYNYS